MRQKAAVSVCDGRRFRGRALCAAAVLLGVILPASAAPGGSISLNTVGNVQVGKEIEVSARVTNRGDEPAYEVRPEFSTGSKAVSGEMVEVLAPNQPHAWQVSLGGPPPKPGRYAVRALIEYRDANSYQFSALVMMAAVVGEARAGDVVATVEPARLDPGGEMKVEVTNRGSEPRRVSFFVDTPREIIAEVPLPVFALGAGQSRTLRVPLRAAGALAGSSYAVFARIEYETPKMHFSEFFGSVANVEVTRAAPYRRWVIGAAIVLGLAALALQLRQGRRRRS